jgi:uncharacterized membrane protein YraQ (UPF0718 family)
MDGVKLKKSFAKAGKSIWNMLPVLVGVVFLTSFLAVAIPNSFYVSVLGRNMVWDAFVGNIIGSIAAGNPTTSYVLGGELLDRGVSLVAVAAFLVAWGTVGVVQLPAEAKALGKKFALVRILVCFIFVFAVSIAVATISSLF